MSEPPRRRRGKPQRVDTGHGSGLPYSGPHRGIGDAQAAADALLTDLTAALDLDAGLRDALDRAVADLPGNDAGGNPASRRVRRGQTFQL